MSLPTRGNGGKIIRHLHLYCPLSLPCSSWPRQFYSCTCETIESIRIPPPTTLATPDSTNYTSICLAPALSTRPSQSAFSPMAKRTTTPLPCSASVIRFAVRSFLVQDNKKRQEVKAIQVWKEQPDTWGRCGSSGDSAPVRGAGASRGSAFDGSRPQRRPICETGDAN